MLPDISNTVIEPLTHELFAQKELDVAVLRLDRIHPVISGNKLFKLHYFLKEAAASVHKTILTFGGAWSNHLVATAYAGKLAGISTIAVVRGEKPGQLSATLEQCIGYGMKLKFISRSAYSLKDDPAFIHALKKEYGDFIPVPEGGYHQLGAKGASLIMRLPGVNSYTHICTAAGTATTLAGLVIGAIKDQQIIGVPVLKGESDIMHRVAQLTGGPSKNNMLQLLEGYHFGGYAKSTEALFDFMNQAWQQFHVPLDFVYTAKMFYAVTDAIKKDHFPKGSRVLCIHTGGLQGNKSLPVDTLLY